MTDRISSAKIYHCNGATFIYSEEFSLEDSSNISKIRQYFQKNGLTAVSDELSALMKGLAEEVGSASTPEKKQLLISGLIELRASELPPECKNFVFGFISRVAEPVFFRQILKAQSDAGYDPHA